MDICSALAAKFFDFIVANGEGSPNVVGDRGNLDRVNVTGKSYYTEFRYDGVGDRWVQYRTVSGQTITRSFLYDREDVAVDFNGEYGTVKTVVVNGPGIDEVLSVRVGGVLYPVLHDGLGSVTGLMNSAGSLVNTYNYKAYGESLSTMGSEENRYRYKGREYVETGNNETELYYYRARYYRPDLGRFISKDPLGMIDGTNMFVYVQNNSVMWIDPFGLNELCPCGVKIEVGAAVGPSNALRAWELSNETRTATLIAAENDLTGATNGPLDAFRHCYWSCRMAQELGSDIARRVTTTYENCAPNSPDERCMDQKTMPLAEVLLPEIQIVSLLVLLVLALEV